MKIARHPKMLSNFVMAVLTSAIDTEGDLPEDLTARLKAKVELEGSSVDRAGGSGEWAEVHGSAGAELDFWASGGDHEHPVTKLRSSRCGSSRSTARSTLTRGARRRSLEAIRLASDRLTPGESLRIRADLKPYQGEAQQVELSMELPADLAEGKYEVVVCDSSQSLRRRSSNEPQLAKPEHLDALLKYLALQAELKRSMLFAHVEMPERGPGA